MPVVRPLWGVVTWVTSGRRRAYHARMAATSAETARGALAGAVAAGVWAAQQPFDKAVFGVQYDDVELLGKAVTRGPAWVPVGTALHVANGALLGALYANVAPRMPLPSWARGPFAALLENFATWPLTIVAEHVHPARKELPDLSRNPRALAQATWRHLLFGFVMGELERRLNAPEEAEVPPNVPVGASPTGHGTLGPASTAASRPDPSPGFIFVGRF